MIGLLLAMPPVPARRRRREFDVDVDTFTASGRLASADAISAAIKCAHDVIDGCRSYRAVILSWRRDGRNMVDFSTYIATAALPAF